MKAATLERYNQQWFDIAARFEDGDPEVVVGPYATRKDAEAFRFEFYNFRAALEKHGDQADYPALQAVRCTIRYRDGQGHFVILWHADSKPIPVIEG